MSDEDNVESWLAFIRRTLDDEQYTKFCELWESHERPVSCPFVEVVTAEPGAKLTPILRNPQSEEVREMAQSARVMRRSPWWDSIPHPTPDMRGAVIAYNTHDDAFGYETGNTLSGEIKVAA